MYNICSIFLGLYSTNAGGTSTLSYSTLNQSKQHTIGELKKNNSNIILVINMGGEKYNLSVYTSS